MYQIPLMVRKKINKRLKNVNRSHDNPQSIKMITYFLYISGSYFPENL